MVDIHQKDHSQILAPQKKHTAHLSRHTCCTSRKLSSWNEEAIRLTPYLGEIAVTKYLVT